MTNPWAWWLPWANLRPYCRPAIFNSLNAGRACRGWAVCNKSLQHWSRKWITKSNQGAMSSIRQHLFWLQFPHQVIVDKKLWLRLFKLQFCRQQIDILTNNKFLWNKFCCNWGQALAHQQKADHLGPEQDLEAGFTPLWDDPGRLSTAYP